MELDRSEGQPRTRSEVNHELYMVRGQKEVKMAVQEEHDLVQTNNITNAIFTRIEILSKNLQSFSNHVIGILAWLRR